MDEEIQFGKGAVKDTPDERDVQFDGIAMASPDFDWEKGYDIEDVLRETLKNNDFRIKAKDQNGSSSCGGQAWSYYGAILEAIATKTYEERSAKFIYAQTFVPPGGSSGRTNCDLVIKQGWAKEALCPSYDAGNAPSEPFMQKKEDITEEARKDAGKAKALLYANVNIDINLFAKAIRDNYGQVAGVTGKDNGTWRKEFPKPPESLGDLWNHWLYCGKAKMINGKKYIGILNSWGEKTGNLGWQWLGEDYFKAIIPELGIPIWSAWTMVFKGEDPAFKHFFSYTLKKGSKRKEEVTALQTALNIEGMYKGKIDGLFGPVTEAAAKNFQKRYSLKVDGIVGAKTNGKLNELYNK